CVIRVGSFRKSMYRFSLPREFELTVSRDGQNFYKAGTVKKITTAGYADIKSGEKVLKLNEDRNRWVDIEFDLNDIEARYIGLTVKPEGFMFYMDEWEVFAGTGKADKIKTDKIYSKKNRTRFSIGNGLASDDAVTFGPAHEIFFVSENTFVPTFLNFSDFRKEKNRGKLEFVIDLPKEVTLYRSYLLEQQFNISEIDCGHQLRLVLEPKGTGKHFKRYHGKLIGNKSVGPLYFQANKAIPKNATASFFCRIGNKDFSQIKRPVQSLNFVEVKNQIPAPVSITWMIDYYTLDWPDFFKSYRSLGFNTVPYFPRLWPRIEALPDSPFIPTSHVAQARQEGFKIIQNESPFHTMKNLGKVACTYEGAKGICPSYRGEYYQDHMRELAECSRLVQPDFLIWDIELIHRSIGGNPANIMKCERCSVAVKKSGKTPQEYLFDCSEEMHHNLYEVAAGVIKNKFLAGQYDVYAGQKEYQKFFQFDRSYPKYLQMSMPAAYSAGLFDVNHRIVQREYQLLKKKWTSWIWTTPGTYGYCAPHKMEALVYEQLLNGGSICIYSFNQFISPIQMFYLNKGLNTISAYGKLLQQGEPDLAFKIDNSELACSKFTDGNESLIFIANYTSPEYEEFNLTLPKGAKRLDVSGSLSPGNHKLKLGPAEFAIYHCRN
ncbi:MAG: hypothetical protein PHQ33_08475, partial [Bacteroidales bacterium]|nr:hypothetical protein [Bacteroidales bacterium]